MNGANLDTTPDTGPKVFQLKYNPATTIEEARENAQLVKDRMAAMLGEASALAAAGKYIRDWQSANKAAMTRGWVKVLKAEMLKLLPILRKANLRGTLKIEIAELGKSFDITRGPDKAGKGEKPTQREWRFSSNEGKKKREKKVRGKALCESFGVK